MTNESEPLVTRIDHVGVAVRDIDASLAYYVDVLGMRLSSDGALADGSARLAYLEAGNTTLQLVQPLREGPVADYLAANGEGLHHVCFAVSDIVEALRSLPGSEREDRVTIGGKRCRVSFIAARPNGMVVELTELQPQTPIDQSASTAVPFEESSSA